MIGPIMLPCAWLASQTYPLQMYHQRCYNACRKPVVTPPDCASLISDTALSSVVEDMDCNWRQQTWTVSDMYKLYQEYDGQLSSKHMISNLSLYYGEELMILCLCKRHSISTVYIKEHETCRRERRCRRRRSNRGDCAQDYTRSQSNT